MIAVSKDSFATYLAENSIRRSVELIRTRHHVRSDKERYLYLFSGLFRRCACGLNRIRADELRSLLNKSTR